MNNNPDYPVHLIVIALLTYKKPTKWLSSHAQCNICKRKFVVINNYTEKWQDKKIIKVLTKWSPTLDKNGKFEYV